MKINAPIGVQFYCNCGISGTAQVSSDFHCTRCNGEDNYFIVCPNCGKKHEVSSCQIPENVKPYIKKNIVGYGHID